MIKLKSVEYKNVMSAGNHPIKLLLDKSPTTIVGGSNGSGKSTSILALVYCLYGKIISGLKLEQAINSINKKGLLVKVEFERYGENWMVIRGEKPKKFEIYRNDELMDQYANARDQQTFLEMILGMDYKLFTQMVVVNKERYVPFMEMSAGDRRKIVEDVLGIGIFSHMNDILGVTIKDNQRVLKNLLEDVRLKNVELNGKKELIAQINASIAESSTEVKDRIHAMESQMEDLNLKIRALSNEKDQLSVEGFDKVKKGLSELNELGIEFETDIKRLEKDKKFFVDNDNCPTCGQSIDDGKHDHISEIDSQISNINMAASQMMETVEDLLTKKEYFDTIEKKISEINMAKSQLQSRVKSLEYDIKELSAKTVNTGNEERLEKALSEYEVIEMAIDTVKKDVAELERKLEIFDIMKTHLKDDGVKAQIVREYNLIMNKKINEYLNAMGFYVNMTIDENFKETFHSMNREGFVYENLSTGQKCRVSIAITLALLEIGSIKNSVSTNLLYLDELLEPIDAQGIIDVMNLFKTKLAHKNVFVITQRFEEFSDLFQSQIKFELNQGFTEMVAA